MIPPQHAGGPAPPRSGATRSETGCSPNKPIEPNPTRHRHRAAVLGVWHPPSGRRTLALVYVPRCELCGGAHTHRATRWGTSFTRSPSCRPGSEYEVIIQSAASRRSA